MYNVQTWDAIMYQAFIIKEACYIHGQASYLPNRGWTCHWCSQGQQVRNTGFRVSKIEALVVCKFNDRATSRRLKWMRVHGLDHNMTKTATMWQQRLKWRYVFISIGQQIYQALRYDDGAKSFIIQGPLPPTTDVHGEPRNLDDEKTFSVPSADITLTPVMLYGLKKAAHLKWENHRCYRLLQDQSSR